MNAARPLSAERPDLITLELRVSVIAHDTRSRQCAPLGVSNAACERK